MYVHEFPQLWCRLLGDSTVYRVETYLAFEPHVAATLPIAFVTTLPEAPDLDVWLDSRMTTNVLGRDDWHSVFQTPARFFVCLRTGGPRRQRGRRAKRWTKVRL